MTTPITEELDNKEVLKFIREIVEFGTVIQSGHAKEQMTDRGYTMHDVEHILCYGKVSKKEFNHKTGHWKYIIKGEALDGEKGAVVTAIIRRDTLILITVLGGTP